MRLRVEQLEARTVPTLLGAAGGAPLGEAFSPDLSQTFQLHSLPDSVRRAEIAAGTLRTAYLDFAGHTIAPGGPWTSVVGGGALATPPYSEDADPSFSDAELAHVQQVWQSVAEDYAPFDVDVTTEPPSESYILGYEYPGDRMFGQRVVIGGSGSWYPLAVGGVSMKWSFGWGYNGQPEVPDFVFSGRLSNNPKYVGEAVAHELGHTLGLDHDGTASSTYYPGGGGWAPVMGDSYHQPVTQWSAGEYAGANNTQDQVGVIAGRVGLRPDDYGDSFATATALVGGKQVTGLIGTRTDVDAFAFTTASGAVTVSFAPAASGADLYAKVSLYDGAGNLIASATPASPSSLGVTITQTLKAGTYYVTVDGVGIPGAATTTDYGSEGQYWLTVQAATTGPTPPTTTAIFIGSDATTQGGWQGTYGADGYWLAQGAKSLPPYATASVAGNLNWTWNGSTQGARALQKPGATDRLAACWYSATAFDVKVSVTDGQAHEVGLYFLDWDKQARSERVDVLDATTGAVLDSRTLSGFSGGQWLTWNVTGGVTFRVARTAGVNAVLSGVFFN